MDRTVLLPPYLEDSEVWVEFVKAVDEVFLSRIDDPRALLAKLRDVWSLPSDTFDKISNNQMLALTDFQDTEREVLIKQATMIGFIFSESDLISDADYQRIVRNLSAYWYGKGTPAFSQFMGFCLNTVIQCVNLWCQYDASKPTSYGTFFPEGDAAIGTPVWEGGSWIPTTHVQLSLDPFKFATVQHAKLMALFYAIANYNLVVEAVVFDGVLYIHTVDETQLVRAVAAVPITDIEYVLTSY